MFTYRQQFLKLNYKFSWQSFYINSIGPFLFNANNVERLKIIHILSYLPPITLFIILADVYLPQQKNHKSTHINKCQLYLHYHLSSISSLFSSQFSLFSKNNTIACWAMNCKSPIEYFILFYLFYSILTCVCQCGLICKMICKLTCDGRRCWS